MPSYARNHQLQHSLLYHVYSRGCNRQVIFKEYKDFQYFKGLLRDYRRRFQVAIYHWVIMSNHYHLVMELKNPEIISKLMAGLHRSYRDRKGDVLKGATLLHYPVYITYSISICYKLNPGSRKHLYQYDELNRLVSLRGSAAGATEAISYAYDKVEDVFLGELRTYLTCQSEYFRFTVVGLYRGASKEITVVYHRPNLANSNGKIVYWHER